MDKSNSIDGSPQHGFLQDEHGHFSSVRLAFFMAVVVASILSIGGLVIEIVAIVKESDEGISTNYMMLCGIVWLIATLQKNWAKWIEKLRGK